MSKSKLNKDDKLRQNFEDYSNLAATVRGRLLNEIIDLERIIDEYMAYYICGTDEERRLKYILLVAQKLGLRGKKDVMVTLHPTNKNLKEQLDCIIDLRNVLAHKSVSYELDLKNSVQKNHVIFKEKQNTKPTQVGKRYLEDFSIKIWECSMEIIIMTNRIRYIDAPPTK